jgi:hypothetical protein
VGKVNWQWCSGYGEQGWRSSMAVLGGRVCYGELMGGREQSKRVRIEGSSSFASLFSPYWPDWSGRCQRTAATWCT